jgi:serine/threonine protein kinase
MSTNLFTKIEKYLENFGLKNFNLNSGLDVWALTTHLLTDETNFGTFTTLADGDIEYKWTLPNGSEIIKKYKIEDSGRESGGENQIKICTDNATNKKVVLRNNISETNEVSLVENIKHYILYILTELYLGGKEYIVQPFYIGLGKINDTTKIFITMEKGDTNLLDKFNGMDREVSKLGLIIPITKSLSEILNELNQIKTLPDDETSKINFKHGDLKLNNIIINSGDCIKLIDFGISQFEIKNDNGVIQKFPTHYNYIESRGSSLITHNPIYYSNYKLNITHDLLMFISSLNLVYSNICIIFDLSEENNIFHGRNMCAYFRKHFGDPNNKSLYNEFYKASFDIKNDMLKNNILTDSLKYSDIIWDNSEIFVTDFTRDSTDEFMKYLKYKAKYLHLKNKINKKIVL